MAEQIKPSPEWFDAARNEGYSDREIVDYLGKNAGLGEWVSAARKEGYSPTEMVDFLNPPKPAPGPAPKEEPKSGLINGMVKAVGNAALKLPGGVTETAGTAMVVGANIDKEASRQQLDLYRRLDAGEEIKAGGAPLPAREFDPNDPDAPMDIGGPRANRANAAKTRELTWANQYLAADPEQREAMKKHAESVINGPEGVIESTGKALQRGGESLMHWADSTIPLTDEEKSRFSVQSVQLAARMVPIVAAAIASGGTGLVVAGGLDALNTTYTEAIKGGADPERAAVGAAESGAINGVLNLIPGPQAVRLFEKLPSSAKNKFAEYLAEAALGAGNMISMSQLTTLAENAVAASTYEPGRKWDKGLGENLGVQATVGGAVPLAFAGTGAAYRRMFGVKPVEERGKIGNILDGETKPEAPTPEEVQQTVMSGTSVEDAAAKAREVVSRPQVEEVAEAAQFGSDIDRQQASLVKLALASGNKVERTNDGEFFLQNSKGEFHPLKVWDGVAREDTISTELMNAQRDLYGRMGIDVVYFEGDQRFDFDGAINPKDPNTIYLSNDPSRNLAQVGAHEIGHALETSGLWEAYRAAVDRGLTEEGKAKAERMFSDTAPKRERFAEGPEGDAAHADATSAHYLREMSAEIFSELPKLQTFIPKVIDEVQARYGADAAKAMVQKFLAGLRDAMTRLREMFFKPEEFAEYGAPPVSLTHLLTNISEVHDLGAKIYAERFGTQAEKERAALRTMQERTTRERLLRETERPATEPPPPTMPEGFLERAPEAAAPRPPAAYEEAAKRAATYRRWLNELDEQRRAEAPESEAAKSLQGQIDAILGEVRGNEERLTDEARDRLEAARVALQEVVDPVGDNRDMARVRAALETEQRRMAEIAGEDAPGMERAGKGGYGRRAPRPRPAEPMRGEAIMPRPEEAVVAPPEPAVAIPAPEAVTGRPEPVSPAEAPVAPPEPVRAAAPEPTPERAPYDPSLQRFDDLRSEGTVSWEPPVEWQPSGEELSVARRLARGLATETALRRPQSLVDFVRKNGGLRMDSSEGGDVRSADLNRFPGLLRHQGLQADWMAERARDAGYNFGKETRYGSGVDVDAFINALIEDGSKRVRHYPESHDTEAWRQQQAMMAEVHNYFEDIGLQPKGMDPRRLAWLLRQEPETARTLALAERADRLSREGSIELAQRLDAERAQAERDMAPEPGAWDMADHRDIPGPTREEVERYYGEFQAVAGKDRAGEPVAPQGRPASEDEAANRFLASTRPEGAGAAAEVPRTGSRGDAALAGDRWEPLYSPRDDRQTGFDFDQKRSQRGTDDLPLFGKGGRERPAEPPARPTERPEPRPAPEGDLFAARPETPAREPVREPVREPTPGREPTMIQDAGEKIGGARKDLWAERGLRLSDLEGMTEGEAYKNVTKDAAWPKPDFAALVRDGMEPQAAALLKIIRDRLGARPRNDSPQGRRDYVEVMGHIRDAFADVKTAKDFKAARDRIIYDMVKYPRDRYAVTREISDRLFSVFKGRKENLTPDYTDLRRAQKLVQEGFPGKADPWTRRFDIRELRDGTFAVLSKGDGKVVRRGIESREAAEGVAQAAYEEALSKRGGELPVPQRPHLDSIERTGADIRGGRNVTGEDFVKDFGFRGIEFGNWVASDERQKIINYAYDGLHDMANVLGIPVKALSLDGKLGLAFGARGGGFGVAHYEPDKLVINMTKLSGAGSLAHEWAHALDHYFGVLDTPAGRGEVRGASGWYNATNSRLAALKNLRPEMAEAFDNLMTAIFKRDKSRAEAVRDAELRVENYQAEIETQKMRMEKAQEQPHSGTEKFLKQSRTWIEQRKLMLAAAQKRLGELRDETTPFTPGKVQSSYYEEAQKLSGKSGSSGYWARPTEMFARAFESYIFDKIKDEGGKSQYLVQGVEPERNRSGYKGNPYPDAERPAINAAFDKLFETMDVREGEKGPALFSPRQEERREPAPTFYSGVERALQSAKIEKAPPGQWLGTLKNLPGVKPEEMKYLGLEDWLKQQPKSVTKQEVLDYVRANQIEVREVMKGERKNAPFTTEDVEQNAIDSAINTGDIESRADWANASQEVRDWHMDSARRELEETHFNDPELRNLNAPPPDTKYQQYTLPGGENYRELLLTLPPKTSERGDAAAAFAKSMNDKYGLRWIGEMSDAERRRYDDLIDAQGKQDNETERQNYKSSHWEEPNVLAHIRFDDRTGPNGERVLHVAEIQSDWHQAGRKRGYNDGRYDSFSNQAKEVLRGDLSSAPNDLRWVLANPELGANPARLAALRERFGADWVDEATASLAGGKDQVPDAPFKTTWPELAMKRMIRYAAENGYDRISWDTGATNAERYDLSKQIDRIGYTKRSDGKYVFAAEKDGAPVLEEDGVTLDRIADVLGKEIATKIERGEGRVYDRYNGNVTAELTGLDLKVGGEGMTAFYDKQLPLVANKLGKKFGAKVEQGSVPTGDKTEAAHSLPITDAMRRVVVEEGQPLFSPRVKGTEDYDPAQAAAAARVRGATEKTLLDKLEKLKDRPATQAAVQMVDPYAGIKERDAEGYIALRNANSTTGAQRALMEFGPVGVDKDGTAILLKDNGGAKKLFEDLGPDAIRWADWVAASRAERLTAEERERNYKPEDIATLKGLVKGTLSFDYTLSNGKTTRSREAAFLDALKRYDEFNKAVKDLGVNTGMVSREVVDKLWADPFYIPFFRQAAEEGTTRFQGPGSSGGMSKQYLSKKLKGGEERLNEDLLENIEGNWRHMIDASLRNAAANKVLMKAEKDGIAARIPEADATGKDVTWTMVDGKKQFWRVDDPLAMTALEAVHRAENSIPFIGILRGAKRLVQTGVAASPIFQAKNLMKDATNSVAISPLSLNVFKNLYSGMKQQDVQGALVDLGRALLGKKVRERELSMETMQAITGGATMEFGSGTGNIFRGSTYLDTPSKLGKFGDYFRNITDAYEKLSTTTENNLRLALYEQMRKDGKSHAEAAFAGRDLNDYSLRGASPVVRFFVDTVPFLNPWMQGLYKVGRVAASGDRTAQMRLAGVFATMAAAVVMNDAFYADDEDFKARNEDDRNTNFWFKFDGNEYRIPMGFEVAALARLATNWAETLYAQDMTAGRAWDNTLKILGTQMALNPTPQIVKPLIDVYANKSRTGAPIENAGMERLRPEYRTAQDTTMVAKWASQALNEAWRMVRGPAGELLSPVQIDYLIRGYGAWLGTTAMQVVDYGMREASGQPDKPERDWLRIVTGDMASTTPTSQRPNTFYTNMLYEQGHAIQQAYATLQDLAKRGKADEAREYMQDNRDLIARYPLYSQSIRAETELNQQIRAINESRDLTPEQKRLRIMQLNAVKNRVAEGVFRATGP